MQCFTWLKEVLNQFCILWLNQCWSANPDIMCDHRVLVKKLRDHSLDQLEPKQRRSYSVWWTLNSIYQDKRRKYINVFLQILERFWTLCHYRLFLAKLYFKTNLLFKLKLGSEFGWLMVDKLLKRDLPTYKSILIKLRFETDDIMCIFKDYFVIHSLFREFVCLLSYFGLRHGSELLNLKICIFIAWPDGNNVNSDIKWRR